MAGNRNCQLDCQDVVMLDKSICSFFLYLKRFFLHFFFYMYRKRLDFVFCQHECMVYCIYMCVCVHVFVLCMCHCLNRICSYISYIINDNISVYVMFSIYISITNIEVLSCVLFVLKLYLVSDRI